MILDELPSTTSILLLLLLLLVKSIVVAVLISLIDDTKFTNSSLYITKYNRIHTTEKLGLSLPSCPVSWLKRQK